MTRAALRRGGWRRLFPDVYVASDVLLDHRLWCEAAIVYVTGSCGPRSPRDRVARRVALSGRTAARLLGVDVGRGVLSAGQNDGSFAPLPGCELPIEITAPPAARSRLHGSPLLCIIRSRLDVDDVVLSSRLPITSPERTAFDLARGLPRGEAVATVDAMLNKRMVTLAQIRVYLLASPPVRGRGRVAGVLAVADPLAQSPMESALRLVIVDAGLPRPEAQVPVRDHAGRLIGHVDLGYRRQRMGIEYEGDYHRDKDAFRRDIARVNAMQEAGWVIVRVTARDIRDPTRMVRQISALLERRSANP